MNAVQSDIRLTAEVVGDKAVKNISFEQCAHPEDFEGPEWEGKQYWIQSLEGLEHAKSLEILDIAYVAHTDYPERRIESLEPIAGLTQLKEIILKQNGIDDISPLSGLVNLTLLDLSANKLITDISAVADMTKLQSLNVSYNKVESAEALKNLENLEYVNISNNQITQLPDLSKLTKVYFLDASNNQLTDVSALAGMKGLEQLSLKGNTGITDYTPLANLTRLDEAQTTLPDESKKADLFAAIEVNRLLELFNISRMAEEDLENVQIALDAYQALTQEQKSYIDAGRIAAARNNMERIQNGLEPEYYEEYDIEVVKRPVFSRVEINVVNKNGVPIEGAEFVKVVNGGEQILKTITTDSVGRLVLKHSASDALYDEIVIQPASDKYVAVPAKVTYTVSFGNKTESVNGRIATGLEELQITLIPKDEYVDKSQLQDVLKQADAVEDSYKYTESTYKPFEQALETAKKAYDAKEASQQEVSQAAEALQAAIDALKKTDKLTVLKLIVKDENGNRFTRPFKLLLWESGSGAQAWNEFSDENGEAYLDVNAVVANWAPGKTWEIRDCFAEAYDIKQPSVKVTIGVENGQMYFKTVDGKAVDVDFEKEVIMEYTPDDTTDKIVPDGTTLQKVVETAKALDTTGYTPASIETLTNAVALAEKLLEDGTSRQENYNAAVAAIKNAMNNLTEIANKLMLQREITKGYVKTSYTSASWKPYEEALAKANEVYADENATQEQVDQATEDIRTAGKALVAKADKSKLEEELTAAKALKEDDYKRGFVALKEIIKKAEAVYAKEDASQAEVNALVEALQEAQKALVKKPAEVKYDCYPAVFRARVLNKWGAPVAGVVFEVVIDGKVDAEKLESDGDGILTYHTYDQNNGKTTVIRLADEGYTTSDEHSFKASGKYAWDIKITEIDGKAYADGTNLIYTVASVDGNDPKPVDKSVLDKETHEAEIYEVNAEGYSEESFKEFQKSLEEARKVSDDKVATQEQVDQALEDLREAIQNLAPAKMDNPFVDVKEGQYYYDPVLWAVNKKITSGTTPTTFSPEESCTRAQVVTFLWRANGSPEPKSTTHAFVDIKESDYFYKPVLWAVENGITAGTSATTFTPDRTVTRSEVVTFLWREAGKEAVSTANPFKDVKAGQFYTDAVLWAVGKAITNGTSATTFSPDASCTRGQVVSFLYRAEK